MSGAKASLISKRLEAWFKARGWKPFDFQREVWQAVADGQSGLLHATTGAGKTLAGFLPTLADLIEQLTPARRRAFLRLWSGEIDGEILSEIDESIRDEVIEALPDHILAAAVQEMETDDVVYLAGTDLEQLAERLDAAPVEGRFEPAHAVIIASHLQVGKPEIPASLTAPLTPEEYTSLVVHAAVDAENS